MNTEISTAMNTEIANQLIHWFSSEKRALPWRVHYQAYHIWIAEMMLQQTQVSTMLPYYQRWMKDLPSIAAVASAELNSILKHWEGLGYYQRAKHIHQAAQQMMQQHDGYLPNTKDALLSLPGIGPYTAGAILSIAFNQPAPIVDGNVARVFSRVLGIGQPLSQPAVKQQLWQMAAELVQMASSPRQCNEGLMELGALICKRTRPLCSQCPIQRQCYAFQQGTPEQYPVPVPKKAKTVLHGNLWLISHQLTQKSEPQWLLRKNLPNGLWGGLWEFPWQAGAMSDSPSDKYALLCNQLQPYLHNSPQPLNSISHTLTHLQFELTSQLAMVRTRPTTQVLNAIWTAPCKEWGWFTYSQITQVPLSKLSHKAFSIKLLQ